MYFPCYLLILITYVLRVSVCPGEGIVAFNAKPNPFHLNKICLNQRHAFKLCRWQGGGEDKNFHTVSWGWGGDLFPMYSMYSWGAGAIFLGGNQF